MSFGQTKEKHVGSKMFQAGSVLPVLRITVAFVQENGVLFPDLRMKLVDA